MDSTIDRHLRIAIETGRFDDLAELYAPDAQFDAALAGRDIATEGPDAIVAELAAWWTGPGQLDQWDVASSDGGLRIVLERSAAANGTTVRHRQLHYIQAAGSRIDRHVVRCARPQLGPSPPVVDPTPSFLRHSRDRRPFDNPGMSGSWLERVVLADGRPVIVKHISPEWDWIMRATHDTGREATLWRDGILQQLPGGLDFPVIAVEREGNGWAIALRDISDALLPVGETICRDDSRRLLAAADAMHRRFEGRDVAQACTLADRCSIYTPATARAEHEGNDLVPKMVGRGWEQFADQADGDLVAVVLRMVEDPTPLVAELSANGTTLVHGDFRQSNLAIAGDRVQAVDWAMACQAPAEVEFCWYLQFGSIEVDASRQQLVDDWREIRGSDFDDHRLDLAILCQLVMFGWTWATEMVTNPDPEVRALAADDLAWYTARSRRALELWSPEWTQ